MYPNVADRADYEYPEDGLLQIYGVVPDSEIRQPTQRNAKGDPVMPVIKNGMTTGTTVGWVNGLKSLVRHYDHYDIDFTSLETPLYPTAGVARSPMAATPAPSSSTGGAVSSPFSPAAAA
jgi:hypothetical protein